MGEKQGHTPGPCTYGVPSPGANFSIYSTKMSIGRLGIASNSKRAAEGEANARLIAAAPDLLAAVWALVKHFERVDGDASHKAVIKQATDAIGKATNRLTPTGEDSPANEGEG